MRNILSFLVDLYDEASLGVLECFGVLEGGFSGCVVKILSIK